jgi:uncharacterized Tic20 family protein
METLTKLDNQYDNQHFENASHAPLIHLSAFASFIIPFGSILGPLITWMIWKDSNDLDNQNGKQAVNFNLSIALYNIAILIIGVIIFVTPLLATLEMNNENPVTLLFSLPGIWLLLGGFSLLGLIRIILIIVAAIKSGNGEVYEYPFTIQFIK